MESIVKTYASRSAKETENSKRLTLFDRGDYYTAVGWEANFLASRIFHTNQVVKHARVDGENVAFLNLSYKLFIDAVIHKLVLESLWSVETLKQSKSSEWTTDKQASPGFLHAFSEELASENSETFDRSKVEQSCFAFLALPKKSQAQLAGVCIANTLLRTFGVCAVQVDQVPAFLQQEGVKQCMCCNWNNENETWKSLLKVLQSNSITVTKSASATESGKSSAEQIAGILGVDSFNKVDEHVVKTVSDCKEASIAAKMMVEFIQSNTALHGCFRLATLHPDTHMFLSSGTFPALALFPAQDVPKTLKSVPTSLFDLFARFCVTSAGRRLLVTWIRKPSTDLQVVKQRHDVVESLVAADGLRMELSQSALKRIPDGERLAVDFLSSSTSSTPSANSSCNNNDGEVQSVKHVKKKLGSMINAFKLIRLVESLCEKLNQFPETSVWLQQFQERFDIPASLLKCQELVKVVQDAVDVSQLRATRGSATSYAARVRPEVSPILQRLGHELNELERQIFQQVICFAKANGHVDSVKFRALGRYDEVNVDGSNKQPAVNNGRKKSKRKPVVLNLEDHQVHGTSLRVTKIDSEKVLVQNSRKKKKTGSSSSSLSSSSSSEQDAMVLTRDKTGVRFTTSALQRLVKAHTAVDDKYRHAEEAHVSSMLLVARSCSQALFNLAKFVAHVDLLNAFACAAAAYNYSRPVVAPLGTGAFSVVEGRHPLVEHMVGASNFIPNGFESRGQNTTAVNTILFGPNMGGKSTFIRQIALLAVMNQIGSFVPAARAHIPLFDAVLARVGAKDDAAAGSSTLMVEMTDMASILNRATCNSLVVVDEIGRGTSVEDGLRLAASITKHLALRIRCISLVATHFFELSKLESLSDGRSLVQCLHMNAQVKADHDVVMLYNVCPGASNKSYGLAIAKLAGFPSSVVDAAQQYLQTLSLNKCG